MKYHLVSAALIIVAIVLEMAGFSGGSSDPSRLLLVAGFTCEAWFWIRVFRAKAQRRMVRSTAA